MKALTIFKEKLFTTTFLACFLLMASCDNNQKPEDTKDVAEEHNDAKFDNEEQKMDAQFLVNAAENNLAEIQLGQLAQQKGSTTHVRELGKMMVEAHSKSLNDLTALAKSKVITIPTSPTENAKETYENLNEKTGKDFDKAYSDMMVDEHKDAIGDFEKASTDSNDPDIKNWAAATLPVLRTHLDRSLECQKKCEKM